MTAGMLKILFLVEQYADEGSRFYREFFRHLGERGAEVSVLNLSRSDTFESDVGSLVGSITQLDLDGNYRRALPHIRSAVSRQHVDVVQAIETIPAYYGARALLRMGGRKPALVYGRRHGPTTGLKYRLMDAVGFRGSSMVVAVSDAAAQMARREHPFQKQKVRTIYSGVDLSSSATPTPDEQAALDRITASGSSFTVLLLGRLREVKGHQVALDALEELTPELPDLRLLIVGEGPLRTKLETSIERRGLESAVEMVGHVEAIAPFLELADAVIIPSLADAFPKVGIEAFAAGTPVIASAVGGLVDLISDGHSGLLVPPGDSHALAAAIRTLHADPVLAGSLASAGRARFDQSFTMDAMVQAYLEVYREVIAEP